MVVVRAVIQAEVSVYEPSRHARCSAVCEEERPQMSQYAHSKEGRR